MTILLLAGCVIAGATLGLLVAAMLCAAKRADDYTDAQIRANRSQHHASQLLKPTNSRLRGEDL